MGQTTTLVWLGTESARLLLSAHLLTWADVHERTLRPPLEAAPTGLEPYAPDLIQNIERDLEHARISAASLDENRALGVLTDIQRTVRAHPELPQAAWLLAEALAIELDVRRARGETAEVLTELALRRQLLEGARAERASEQPIPLGVNHTDPPTEVELVGLAPQDEFEWNGVRQTPPVVTPRGEHHVRVLRGGRLVWAGWVVTQSGQRTVTLNVPKVPACSADDFVAVRFGKRGITGIASVTCPSWVVARERARGVELALCTAQRCAPLRLWPEPSAQGPLSTRADEARSLVPHFVVGGVVAATLTGLLLWQAGVFETSDAAEPRWVFGGVERAGTSFGSTF